MRGESQWPGSEWSAVIEFGRLVSDPVYYGRGLPRGDGRRVLLLPGLLATDLSLQPMGVWLSRIGYRPVLSGWIVNAGCPERLSRRAESEVSRALREGTEPFAVIGHSRGGILGWAIAARLQERVSHRLALGSPVGAARLAASRAARAAPAAAPTVVRTSQIVRRLVDPDCSFPDCGCPFPDDLCRALSERTTVVSIRTRDDRVVWPEACVIDGARNIEVTGTHSGLAVNVQVYRAIATALAAR